MGNNEIFQQIATTYDTDDRIKIAKVSSNEIMKHIYNLQEAIDFGCGTGLVGLELHEYFEEIIFLDTSIKMLEIVDEKIKANKIKNAKTFHIDIEKEENIEIKVDCIFMVQVLLHIKYFEETLKKLYNNLKTGGKIIIVDFKKNHNVVSDLVHNGFEKEDLINIMKNIGFYNIDYKIFYKGEKIFMGEHGEMFILTAQK